MSETKAEPRVLDVDPVEQTLADEAYQDSATHQELVRRETEALKNPSLPEARSVLEAMARLEHGAAIMDRWQQLIRNLRRGALRDTEPQHWVKMKPKDAGDGEAMALARWPALAVVAEYYQVELEGVGPMDGTTLAPIRTELGDGVYSLRIHVAAAVSKTTGRRTPYYEAEIRSDEDFTGRKGNDGDVRSSLITRARSKGAGIVSGLRQVTLAQLEAAWTNTPKRVADCQRGSGFGSAGDRRDRKQQQETPEDVRKAAALFGQYLTKVVLANGVAPGDEMKAHAADLLQELTKNPKKNLKGIRTPERFSAMFQIEIARKALLAHDVYGEFAQRLKAEYDAAAAKAAS